MTDWKTLDNRFAATADRRVLDLFKDPKRADDFCVQTQDMRFDYSKTNIPA